MACCGEYQAEHVGRDENDVGGIRVSLLLDVVLRHAVAEGIAGQFEEAARFRHIA
jgi:hypothetical protein